MIIHRANRFRKLNPAFLTAAAKAYATATAKSGGGGSGFPAPIAWYLLHETTGTTFSDSSGNGHTQTISGGTAVGSQASRAGYPSSCAYFSSSGSTTTTGTNTPYSAALDFNGSQPFTLSTWMNLDNTTGNEGAIAGTVNPSGSGVALYQGWSAYYDYDGNPSAPLLLQMYNNYNSNQGIQVRWSPPNAIFLGFPGEPCHIVMTYDGSGHASGVKCYAQGTLLTPTVVVDSLTGSTANGVVGMSLAQFYPPATSVSAGMAMADLRVYNVALTQAQVTTLYNNGIAV